MQVSIRKKVLNGCRNENMYRQFPVLIVILLLLTGQVFAQTEFLLPIQERNKLALAPAEQPGWNASGGIPLSLTLPDGSSVTYRLFKNQVKDPQMSMSMPDLVTLTGYADGHRNHTLMLVVNGTYFHGFLLSENPRPIYFEGTTGDVVVSYYGEKTTPFSCATDHRQARPFTPGGLRTSTNGSTLKNYTIAILLTDEFESANGGTAAATTLATSIVSDMSVVYKRELAVTLTANIKTETATFNIVPPASPSATYGGQCINAYFTSAEYDLGQVLHNWGTTTFGGAGIAILNSVCNNDVSLGWPRKGCSWSEGNPNNNYSFLSVAIHEAAHMFSATHTFNSNDTNCDGQRSNATSYEPGSGTSLMCYPGVCNAQNITDANGNVIYESSPYFHVANLEQMVTYINGNGNSCDTESATGNTPPSANANPCGAGSVTIPANTPFELTGSYTDTDPDGITYTWDQYNTGTPYGAPDVACGSTTGPIFRSYGPSLSPTRTFPSLSYILNNANVPPLTTIGECLPQVGRTINFRMVVRDNNAGGGGIDVSAIQLTVAASTGLSLATPNTAVTWAAGSIQTVTWNVNSTNSICNNMNIRLSVDGGITFPYILAAATANDGSQSVTIPTHIPTGTTCRIKIESNCHSCVRFFDIGNANFTITGNCLAPQTQISPTTMVTYNAGDPLLNLGLTNNTGTAVTTFSGTLSSTDTDGNLVFLNGTPAACTQAGNATKYDVVLFVVNTTGSYTIAHGGASGTVINLYEYSFAGSGCTNHVSSNATRPSGTGGISLGANLTATLTANRLYYLMVSNFSSSLPTLPSNYTISFPTKPSGSQIYNGVILPANYSYTYAAVNQSTGNISSVSNTSDFTTLQGGTFFVYGAAYYSGPGTTPPAISPSSWVGQPFSTIAGSDGCIAFSGNYKQVNVICSSQVTSASNNGVGTLRALYGCNTEGATLTFATGINPVLTADLPFDKNITLDGNTTGGLPETTITLSYSGTYGLKVYSGKTVTWKDVIVAMPSLTSSPIVRNEGILTLQNMQIDGNTSHTSIIQNEGSAQLTISQNVTIKK